MLTAIGALIQLLTSSGAGVLFGHIFGWLNRREDARTHSMDLQHEEKKWDHDLAMRDKDREMLQTEWEARAQVASIEVEGKIAQADADALRAAQEADKATYGDKWIDGLRGIVRPVLTFLLVGVALYVNYVLLQLLREVWPTLDTQEKVKLAMVAVEWLFFQAGASIGFWFGSRGQPRVKSAGK